MTNEDTERSAHPNTTNDYVPFNTDYQVSLHNNRIALITCDAELTNRIAAILTEFDVVHIDTHDQIIPKEPDFFYLFDVRADNRFLNKIDEPCIALTDSTEDAVLADLFNVGFTDILPVSLLDSPQAAKHIIMTGIVRKETLSGNASLISTHKLLPDFAALMLNNEVSEVAVGTRQWTRPVPCKRLPPLCIQSTMTTWCC